jgi:outer membrane immunogenic protein
MAAGREQAPRHDRVASPAAVTLPPAATGGGAYAMATKAPLAPMPSWTGAYAGAAFGLGRLGATSTQSSTSVDSSTGIFSGTFVDTSTDVSIASLSGHGPGALVNLFVGYNWMLTSNFLIGAQLEGGVSNIRAKVSGSDPFFSVGTDVGTPGGTTVNTESGVDSFTDSISNRWLVSALVRGGWSIDSQDLIYVLGGVTYGRFEWGEETFGMFGGTVGVGVERQIAPLWTLKAEYRYTKFQNKTINTSFAGAGSTVSTGFNPGTESFIEAGTTANAVTADMHSVMFGISHYFGAY